MAGAMMHDDETSTLVGLVKGVIGGVLDSVVEARVEGSAGGTLVELTGGIVW